MEATQRATPQVTLQVSVVKWNKVDQNQSTPLTRELFSILVDNAIQVCFSVPLDDVSAQYILYSGLMTAMGPSFGQKLSYTSLPNSAKNAPFYL
jgi:hypothetical protein